MRIVILTATTLLLAVHPIAGQQEADAESILVSAVRAVLEEVDENHVILVRSGDRILSDAVASATGLTARDRDAAIRCTDPPSVACRITGARAAILLDDVRVRGDDADVYIGVAREFTGRPLHLTLWIVRLERHPGGWTVTERTVDLVT